MNRVDKSVNLVFLSLLFFAPWLHGLELPWETFLYAGIFAILLAIKLATSNTLSNALIVAHRTPLLLLLLWLAFQFVYLLPLPTQLIDWLSPHRLAYQVVPRSGLTTLSIATSSTIIQIAENCISVVVFSLCLLVFTQAKLALNCLKIVFFSSALMAVYSQLNHFTNGEYEIFEAIPPWNTDWKHTVRGTFSYKNQYAIYLTVTICIGFGLIIDEFKKQHRRYHIHSLHSFFVYIVFERVGLYVFLLCPMLISLMAANSRGGIIAFLIAITFAVASKFSLKGNVSISKLQGVLIGLITLTLVSLFYTSNSFKRFAVAGLDDHGRHLLHQTAITVFGDFWLLGSGPGTYPQIQHIYKPSALGNTAMSKHAHSDYLEIFATQGILGALLLGLACFFILTKVFRKPAKRYSATVVFSQAGIIALLCHSIFDYNFGTPLFGMMLFLLFAALLTLTGKNNERIQ